MAEPFFVAPPLIPRQNRDMNPIELATDDLRVRILPRGAALVGVYLRAHPRNLVLGFADDADHLNIPVFAGALVGPVANRVSQGRVTLAGETYQMECNEGGVTALHSGALGLHSHLWNTASQTMSDVTLTTMLMDGEDGLPGERKITATYAVSGTSLKLTINAETTKPTPMNIAAHPYWCLDDHTDISAHCLQVHADVITPTDARNIPTGETAPIAGTLFDCQTPRAVPLDPALDINYCLAQAPRPKPQPAATLIGAEGIQLDIATTAPGLQVYNGAHLPALAGVLQHCKDLRPFGAIALEPQFWPDAPNNPAFPQITLMPGETWQQITTYRLTPAI